MIKLIKIGATWCGPCKTLNPVVEAFKNEGLCVVESVDIDEHPEIGEKYNVKGVPTLVFINSLNDEILYVGVGVKTLQWLKAKLQELKDNVYD